MPDQIRTLSCAGIGALLLVLGCAGDGAELDRDRGAAAIAEDGERREAYPPPEHTAAICQQGWPVSAVTGPACTARAVFTCADGWTLQARLEAIVSACGLAPSDEAIEVSLSEGCVTGVAFGPGSPAHDPAVFGCLASALGGVLAACSVQPDCVRLYGTGAPSDW